MPLFTGRVGALPPQYSVDRSAYFDPSQSNPPITFLEVSSLSSLKLSYGISRNPLEKCTLWEYAVRNAKSWVMPSLSSLKRKIGQALELAIREDEEFWNTINETEDKIIIFQDSHWFWGRYRPSNDIYWSGRNEMGELLMLVRDSHRASLAKFMPLEPFPLSSNASSSPSMSAGTRRPMSASLPGAQRPQSIMSMDRIPSGPFSRLATSSSSVESASARSFTVLSGLPDFGTTNLENAPEVLSLRSPRSSISSSGFTPPPPYTSHSGIPNDRPFDSLLLPSHPPAPASSHFIGQSDGLRRDVRRNPRQPVPVTVQQSQTLPNRLRLIPVNEDSEMEALNRLREEYQRDRDQSDRHRLVSDFDDITILRALNARRLNRQEIADVQRKLRNAERERANAEAILSRRGLYQPSYSVGRAIHASSPNIPSMSSAALKKSDELGALRAREIEERIIAHRKAMRYCQDTRREREIERIEGLNGAAMSRRYSMPPLSH